AGRTHPYLHDQIGFYVNTLVLRTQLEGEQSFTALLQQVKATALAAFEHELYPFDRLVEELDIPRDMSRSAVFDVMIVMQNNEQSRLELGDVAIEFEAVQADISKFDLTFSFAESQEGLAVNINYNTDLFRADRAERMFGHLEALMQGVLQAPGLPIGQLDLLPEGEKALLLHAFNDTGTDYPADKTIAELFEEQVERTPDNIAVVFEQTELTYRELNARANRVAHYLRDRYAIEPDDVIALQLERSEWMIVAILGVLKSGAAYLPIAPDAPTARVRYMLEDSRAKALLVDAATFESAEELSRKLSVVQIEGVKCDRIDNSVGSATAQNLAYIIYTSGSSGRPKGTMLAHQGAVNMSLSLIEQYELSEADRVLQFIAYTFDASIGELFIALLSGATLVMSDKHTLHTPSLFLSLVKRHEITVLGLLPVFLSSLEKAGLEGVRILITGGEKPSLPDVMHYSRHLRYFNVYGPTECSVCINLFEVPHKWEASYVPIGKPISNIEVFILGEEQELLPVGIAGELCVSGIGLAFGYLNNPELTAQKFIPHPFKPGERLYRTGDLARWLPDGNIEFLGRIDHQLKIRGYRIEAGEVEQALLAHPGIQSAVVVGHDFEHGKELAAYLAPASGQTIPEVSELRSFLEESLPDYMIPGHFVALEALPLTTSGKVNRKALPVPGVSGIAMGTAYVAPRNAVEKQLLKIWCEILGRDNIGIHDNFFHLGGHSLRAIRLVSLVHQQLSVELKLSQVFAHPTVAGLATQVSEHELPLVLQAIPQVAPAEHYALSNAQRRLWVLHQMDEHLTAYNMPAALRLAGRLDTAALEQAFALLFERHEILRTRFVAVNGEGRQLIDPARDFKLPMQDARAWSEEQIREHIQAHAGRVFDLENERLLQVELLQTGAEEWLLLFNMHHIISDGWSMEILVREWSRLYEACRQGEAEPLAQLQPLPIQYKDYAAWQNNLLEADETLHELRAYWQTQLPNLPTLELPADYPRPAVKTYHGASLQQLFSRKTTRQLQKLSQEQGATLFMTLTALVNVLLYR
ncbi:MAG: amino acid adenylation domain-containing protein, partial [Phaeodactylibacter sp.]|nr:amino acid adenylation domain-containing protein [Phaeodactylibacter sp.]